MKHVRLKLKKKSSSMPLSGKMKLFKYIISLQLSMIRSQCPRQYDRHCRDPKRASGMTQLLHKALLSLFNQSSHSVDASMGDTQSARSSDQLFSMQNRKDASPTNHGLIAPSSYVRNVLAQSLLFFNPENPTSFHSA